MARSKMCESRSSVWCTAETLGVLDKLLDRSSTEGPIITSRARIGGIFDRRSQLHE